MTVSGWTQRAVVGLLPKWLAARLRGHLARAEALATEYGITPAQLGGTLVGSTRNGIEVATLERYRWRQPYTTRDPWSANWDALVAAGLAERAADGWRVTEHGTEVIERFVRDARAYLQTLRLPPLELRRATGMLTGLAARIPASAERAMVVRRGWPLARDARSDVVRLDMAVTELWTFRDDCHVAAWRASGYGGPALDALSQVWEGRTAAADVARALEAKQDAASVEASLADLVRRGDITRDGGALALTARGRTTRDAIERETDRRYFGPWPEGELLAALGDDLTALLAALPA